MRNGFRNLILGFAAIVGVLLPSVSAAESREKCAALFMTKEEAEEAAKIEQAIAKDVRDVRYGGSLTPPGLTGKILSRLEKANGNTYPMYFMEDASVQKIRLAVKGPVQFPEMVEEAQSWIARYRDLQSNIRGLTKKTTSFRAKYRRVQEALASGNFPLTIETPMGKIELANRVEAQHYFDDLSTNWDLVRKGKLRRLDDLEFLRGRMSEQVILRYRLSILLSDMRKFDYKELPFKEGELRALLSDPTLAPADWARKRIDSDIFNRELSVYFGGEKKYQVEADELLRKVRLNDQLDLGIDQSRLSLRTRLLRWGIATVPLQIAVVVYALYGPSLESMHHSAQDKLFLDGAVDRLSQIANEAEYREELRKFMRIRYGSQFDGNRWTGSEEGRKAAERIEALREIRASIESPADRESSANPDRAIRFTRKLLSNEPTDPVFQAVRKEYRERVDRDEDPVKVAFELYGRDVLSH